jgi:hypothetical protein
MLGGQLAFQYPFIAHRTGEEQIDYFYNLLLVSFFGALALAPWLFINAYMVQMGDDVNVLYFFVVVALMLIEHTRRLKSLVLPSYLTYTWLGYRGLVVGWLTVL